MANSTSQSKCFFDLEQVKPYPRYPYAFAQCNGEDCYEYELEQKSRRVILLFVPDDGSNYFTLPGGIGPGSRLKIQSGTGLIRKI